MLGFLAWVALAAPPSIDEPPITGARAPDDMAVVIANEAYTGGFGAVSYASRDADAFAAWLMRTRGLPRVNVARLNGATRKGMAEAVRKAASNVPDGGTLWVYYAGHGLGMQLDGAAAPERVLLGINAVSQAEELPDYVLPVSDLVAMAADSGAAQTVLVLDACFNNAGRDGEALVSGRFAVPVRALTAATNVTVWSATGPKETAVPYEPAGHGAFTYFAIGALSGWADGVTSAPDGKVTLDEAQTYVERAMLSAGIAGQTPQLAGRSDLRAAAGKLAAEPEIAPVVRAARPRGAPGGSSGSFGYDGDLSAQLAAQACEEEAGRLAEAQASSRSKAAAAKVRAEATAAWGRLKAQLDACSKLDDRNACVAAAEKFIAAGKNARAELDAGVETVTTACGERTRAVAGRAVPVSIPEVAEAEAWLGRLAGPVAGVDGRSPTLGVLKWVPPGTFTMGSPPGATGRGDGEVQHQVKLTLGFQMMATEVTQGMYRKHMGSNPSTKEHEGVALVGDDLPVQNVSWVDAVTFANAASKAEGLTACYVISGDSASWTRGCTGYRLPTEAEWEWAARPPPRRTVPTPGAGSQVYAGTSEASEVCAYGNVSNTSVKTKLGWSGEVFPCEDGVAGLAKVRSYLPNGYGLYDLTGNVWEWAWDWYGDYPGAVTDPTGPSSGRLRVIRGGSWASAPSQARVASRLWFSPGRGYHDLGFRLVRSVP